ncbi:hypothetical protein [Bacillus sp. AFS075034]|nr:hypothetical protein [Bacillus sp. AFS075034]
MFNKNSGLVAIWARNIKPNGLQYDREQVPKLSNLQEEVYKKLDTDAAAQ